MQILSDLVDHDLDGRLSFREKMIFALLSKSCPTYKGVPVRPNGNF